LAHAAAGAPARFTGRGVRVPRVENHRRGSPVGEVLAADLDGRRLHPVRREHGGGRHRPAGGRGGEGEGGRAARPGAAGDAAGLEAGRRRDAHGMIPTAGRPVVSGSPRTRLAHWIACPAAPFPRLSSAHNATTDPVRSSKRTVRCAEFEPTVAFVDGGSSSTVTNGAPT